MSTSIDLISLIYEYNSESPLFARIAKKLVDSGEYEKAKEVLDRGINLFPDYATGYFVYSSLYKNTGDTEMAREMAEKGYAVLNEKSTFEYYTTENAEAKENPVADLEFDGEDTSKIDEKKFDSIINEFGEAFPDEEEPETEAEKPATTNKIISETLANIHYSQGHLKEALEIYELLKKKNPDRVEFYDGKIEEIETKLNEHK